MRDTPFSRFADPIYESENPHSRIEYRDGADLEMASDPFG